MHNFHHTVVSSELAVETEIPDLHQTASEATAMGWGVVADIVMPDLHDTTSGSMAPGNGLAPALKIYGITPGPTVMTPTPDLHNTISGTVSSGLAPRKVMTSVPSGQQITFDCTGLSNTVEPQQILHLPTTPQ
jgi:hypothetical protein